MISGEEPGKQSPQSFKTRVGRHNVELRYLLYLPQGYCDQKSQRWPLVLFLHGSGERGNDLERVKHHGLARELEQRADFPAVVVSPQCPDGQRWNPATLAALLDEIEQTYRIDASRIYLMGLSMGGFGAWALAIAQPRRFAAVVPVCGGGEPGRVAAIASVPIWAFHGARDDIVPVGRTLEMIEALRAAGANPRVTIYPDLAHDSWTATYRNPELYDWLFTQRLGASEEPGG